MCQRITEESGLSIVHPLVLVFTELLLHMICCIYKLSGPLPHTVVDFWRLVLQEKPTAIVMLCNIVESHRVKCQQYWPELGSQTYGAVFVRKLSEQKLVDHVIRKFEVQS